MYVISIYFFIVMVKKMLEKMIRTAQENLKALDLGSEEKKKIAYAYAVQTRNKFLAFFEKQSFVVRAKAIAEDTVVRYNRSKSSFRSAVKKAFDALITNRLFIAFARLIQKIFWVCVGISIYAGILVKTQPDGYERVTDVLKHLFPWMW